MCWRMFSLYFEVFHSDLTETLSVFALWNDNKIYIAQLKFTWGTKLRPAYRGFYSTLLHNINIVLQLPQVM